MKKNLVRRIFQFGILAYILYLVLMPLFGGVAANTEAYCPFGGVQSIFTYLQRGTLACSMSMVPMMIGVALGIGVIFFSKLFCAYVCPLGTINEWMGKLRNKLGIKLEITEKSVLDIILRSFKYILLGWIFWMTITSSELFCKNFDPYYALATGFKGEITVWMTSVTMVLFFVCGIVFNMFWCKYICPITAMSNIFKYTATFAGVLVVFILLNTFGIALNYVWLFIVSGAICYVFEIRSYESRWFPLFKIRRDAEKCNGCGLCTKECPMNIDVANMDVVKHVDCTLCGDCVDACRNCCSKIGALSINRKKNFRFIPPIATVVLFALAVFLGGRMEVPTIDERFEGFEEKNKIGQIEMVEMEGLKTIKCFGASKAFSSRMQNIRGVYGVTTFVNRFAARVYFDPSEISLEAVQEAIFSPVRRRLNDVPKSEPNVKVLILGVDGLFDVQDVTILGNILRQDADVYGIQSQYACPVIIKLFVKADKEFTKKELAKIIEIKEFDMPVHGGAIRKVICTYELVTLNKNVEMMPRQEFFELMFPYQEGVAKKNTEKYGEDAAVAVYE
ncbi:MAG: 4Fe-4S binding protein, partial [Bacteroidales bacterium]|nr:4Fe-4S binding protein [Bacteroidales bacterium]